MGPPQKQVHVTVLGQGATDRAPGCVLLPTGHAWPALLACEASSASACASLAVTAFSLISRMASLAWYLSYMEQLGLH